MLRKTRLDCFSHLRFSLLRVVYPFLHRKEENTASRIFFLVDARFQEAVMPPQRKL